MRKVSKTLLKFLLVSKSVLKTNSFFVLKFTSLRLICFRKGYGEDAILPMQICTCEGFLEEI